MQRMRWSLVSTLFFTSFLLMLSLLTLLMLSVDGAAAQVQRVSPAQAGGEEYVVKAGDWLSKISLDVYGSVDAYPAIIDATNAKAQSDPRYSEIVDPDLIEVGQLLWIPADAGVYGTQPSAAAGMTETAASGVSVTETVTSTGSVTATESVTAAESVTATDGVSINVRFVAPQNGDVVSTTVDVEMAAEGFVIEPAGEIHDNAGHFHILVDTDFVAPGELIPFDEQHRHFGQGQLTTTLELEPDSHTLRLQAANGAHLALEGAQYQDTITVTVAGAQTIQPQVRFVTPQDGDSVPSRFEVEMAAQGIIVEPAGEIHDNAGHFHILVDTGFVAPGELIPFDEQHLHFGQGQLTTTVELEPGAHVLRLQLANGAHLALEGAQYQGTITVTVQPAE